MSNSKYILVVDDSESIREAVAFGLEEAGFKVEKAINGADALERFDGKKIDLLLTDFHMPEMNGLELIRNVRSLEQYKRVPILVLTTETQREIIQQTKNAGGTGWIVKPFSMDKLISTIHRLIR
ncbi:response regulator [Sunxiuqinia sp. A32]|uniref:response regulator n=1 Tax=Sunxiuqinia sp. A32 TaxID=3461496 RepID=UPI00404536FA